MSLDVPTRSPQQQRTSSSRIPRGPGQRLEYDIATSKQGFVDAQKDPRLSNILTDRQIFYAFHRHFMIGPSFSDRFRLSIQTVFPWSHGRLLAAYEAVLALWDDVGQRVKPPNEIDLSEGRKCLKSLKQLEGSSRVVDSAALLLLGQVLMVYHIFSTCTSARAINQHALLSTKLCYAELLAEPVFDPISITPILFDTVECLVRREIPAIRVPTGGRFIVDRTLGLCWSLLPLLQDLCEVSEKRKNTSAANRTRIYGTGSTEEDELALVERNIQQWEPHVPLALHADFTAVEVAAMLTQARVYRIAALLIIHRLRYALGEEDQTAQEHANMICVELECFVSWAPENMRGLPVGLPLLVAMLETKERATEIISKLAPFAVHPQHARALGRFVDAAWMSRGCGFKGLWFDLVGAGLQLPLVP